MNFNEPVRVEAKEPPRVWQGNPPLPTSLNTHCQFSKKLQGNLSLCIRYAPSTMHLLTWCFRSAPFSWGLQNTLSVWTCVLDSIFEGGVVDFESHFRVNGFIYKTIQARKRMMIGFVFPICCELTRKVRVSWRFYTNVHQSICIYDVHQSVWGLAPHVWIDYSHSSWSLGYNHMGYNPYRLFLSFFLGWRRPNLITGQSRWWAPDYSRT